MLPSPGTSHEADWLDGVVVALNFIKEQTEGNDKCRAKKIVLISDLGGKSNHDNADIILKSMKKEGVEFCHLYLHK